MVFANKLVDFEYEIRFNYTVPVIVSGLKLYFFNSILVFVYYVVDVS